MAAVASPSALFPPKVNPPPVGFGEADAEAAALNENPEPAGFGEELVAAAEVDPPLKLNPEGPMEAEALALNLNGDAALGFAAEDGSDFGSP